MTDLDFLCVGAHADDVELGMAGTVAKLVRAGRRGAILDLSDASMGTRGTPEERLVEADEAAKILGVERHNMGFRDGFLDSRDPDLRTRFAEFVRNCRPRVVFTHPLHDRHPDHEQVAKLVREMGFLAGLSKYPLEGDAFRPSRIFHWMGARDGEPDFCVDVTDTWGIRRQAIAAYGSQFGAKGPATPISGTSFHELLESRGRFLGSRIRAGYAEGFFCDELPEIVDPCALSSRDF
jgi:bacillithiol biosynthesis deacetylase BshB1